MLETNVSERKIDQGINYLFIHLVQIDIFSYGTIEILLKKKIDVYYDPRKITENLIRKDFFRRIFKRPYEWKEHTKSQHAPFRQKRLFYDKMNNRFKNNDNSNTIWEHDTAESLDLATINFCCEIQFKKHIIIMTYRLCLFFLKSFRTFFFCSFVLLI